MADSELKLIISGDGKLLSAEIKKTERQINGFAKSTETRFGRMNKVLSGKLGSIFKNPFALAGGAAGMIYASKQMVDYQDRISTIGINAGLTAKQLLELDTSIKTNAVGVGQSRDKILDALSEVIDKTGDFEFANAAIRGTGIASTAMSADIMDASTVLSSFRLGMRATSDEAYEMFDVMARMGNIGSFTFAEQAQVAARLFGSAAMAVKINKDNFAEYNAFLQTIKPLFGTPDVAATAVESIMMKMAIDKDKISKKLGFKIIDEKGAIIDFQKTIKAISKLPIKEQSKLFGEFSKAFLPLSDEQGVKAFDGFIRAGTKAGFIQAAFNQKSKEGKFNINRLTEAGRTFADLTLTKPIDELTQFFNNLSENKDQIEGLKVLFQGIGGGFALISKTLITAASGWGMILDLYQRTMGIVADAVYDGAASKSSVDTFNSLPLEERRRRIQQLDKTGKMSLKNDINIDIKIDSAGNKIISTNSMNTQVNLKNRGAINGNQ